jgi:hypothetical protein
VVSESVEIFNHTVKHSRKWRRSFYLEDAEMLTDDSRRVFTSWKIRAQRKKHRAKKRQESYRGRYRRHADYASNDEVERRGVASKSNEAALSQSSTPSVAHRRRGLAIARTDC